MLIDFRKFLTQSNALALAVGVIIGAAVGNVVSALAADVIMPLVSMLLPAGDWRQSKIVLSHGIDAAGKPTENAILYGHLLGAVIDFAIVAFVVFLIIRIVLRPAPPPATKSCPECLDLIPASARRCRSCTAAV